MSAYGPPKSGRAAAQKTMKDLRSNVSSAIHPSPISNSPLTIQRLNSISTTPTKMMKIKALLFRRFEQRDASLWKSPTENARVEPYSFLVLSGDEVIE